MGYKNVETIITLTARQIAQLAQMHGFVIDMDAWSDDELDDNTYTITTCPEAGVFDEETGQIYHTKYCAYADAMFGDGETEPLIDPK